MYVCLRDEFKLLLILCRDVYSIVYVLLLLMCVKQTFTVLYVLTHIL